MRSVANSTDPFFRLRDFIRNQDGIAALEFAAFLPLMLFIYIGSVEVGSLISMNQKVTNTVQTVGNLTTQYTTIYNADMTSILSAAAAVMGSVPTNNLVLTVSEVTTNASGKGTITWSDSLNGHAYTPGQSVTLPTALQTPNVSFIWSQATYPYKPTLGFVLKSTQTLSDQMYLYPRQSPSITRANS